MFSIRQYYCAYILCRILPIILQLPVSVKVVSFRTLWISAITTESFTDRTDMASCRLFTLSCLGSGFPPTRLDTFKLPSSVSARVCCQQMIIPRENEAQEITA